MSRVDEADQHRRALVDQFTRQAVPFSTAGPIADASALHRIVTASGAGPDATVLDVACGAGLVALAFAPVVEHATGIDVTPAMLDRARAEQAARGIANVTWCLGEAAPLDYPDATFSVVVSRFAFHHFLDPRAVLAEMARVCRPDGTIVVVDLTPAQGKQAAFDALDRLRDPSHVHALSRTEWERLFRAVGLPSPVVTEDRLDLELESHLARSFPNPGDDVRFRARVRDALVDDAPGIAPRARADDDTVRYRYPVSMLVARPRRC